MTFFIIPNNDNRIPLGTKLSCCDMDHRNFLFIYSILRKKGTIMKSNASGGAIYGIGILGALVYYLQHAGTIWIGVIGVIKAIFWPAVILYKVLELLKM